MSAHIIRDDGFAKLVESECKIRCPIAVLQSEPKRQCGCTGK